MAVCLMAAALSFTGNYAAKSGVVGFWLFRTCNPVELQHHKRNTNSTCERSFCGGLLTWHGYAYSDISADRGFANLIQDQFPLLLLRRGKSLLPRVPRHSRRLIRCPASPSPTEMR